MIKSEIKLFMVFDYKSCISDAFKHNYHLIKCLIPLPLKRVVTCIK